MYAKEAWSANIELDQLSTLEELHEAIQEAVNFDDEHLYSYFVARADTAGKREYFDDDNGLVFSKTLKDMFPLPRDRSLFYLFDWGDEWVFKIALSRKRPHEPVNGLEYPRVVSESGARPVQYPEDEYDEDEDEE